MREFLRVAALLILAAAPASAQWPWQLLNSLKSVGTIDSSLVTECSGIVQSLRYNGVYWVHGDSGTPARIVPVTIDGKLARGWSGPVAIEGCKNNDWEDIALDGKGNLIIADVGNNLGRRKQLMLHFVREPKPGAKTIRPDRTLRVHYEDQKAPSPDYDCEAVYSAGGSIYFLTKRRSDTRTCLYRLAGDSTKASNPLRLVDSFDIGGMVTAADVSPDGKTVAVTTYSAIWVFEYDAKSGSIFKRSIRQLPIFAWQNEGLAFDGNDSLVLTNEDGRIYRVSLADFKIVRP